MSPYDKELKTLEDVSPYFKKDEKNSRMIFVGDTLEVRIPLIFKKYRGLEISDVVTTIGVCDLIINNEFHVGLNILAQITIEPSDFKIINYNKLDYLCLTLNHGDVFMSSYRVVQDTHVVYVLWTEFITYGKLPYWFGYDDLLKIFINAVDLTGSSIGVSQSVFAGIIGHLARDKYNISKQYRLTNMERPMKWVALNSISLASSSTIARLNGSYFKSAGIVSALNTEVTETQPFENILRGISSTAFGEDPGEAIL